MIKEAIDRIIDLAKIQTTEIDGHHYSRRVDGLRRIKSPEENEPETLIVQSLTGLVDYLRLNPDNLDKDNLFLHIVSPYSVALCDHIQPGNDNNRFIYAQAQTTVEGFRFNHWMPLEDFILSLMTCFVAEGQLIDLIALCGKVCNEKIESHSDDGVSQTIKIKTGITTRAEHKVENPIVLKPHMTFCEVDNGKMLAILRFKNSSDGMRAALFRTVDGLWQDQVIGNIEQYLAQELSDIKIIK
jgi:hypothetical protein